MRPKLVLNWNPSALGFEGCRSQVCANHSWLAFSLLSSDDRSVHLTCSLSICSAGSTELGGEESLVPEADVWPPPGEAGVAALPDTHL